MTRSTEVIRERSVNLLRVAAGLALSIPAQGIMTEILMIFILSATKFEKQFGNSIKTGMSYGEAFKRWHLQKIITWNNWDLQKACWNKIPWAFAAFSHGLNKSTVWSFFTCKILEPIILSFNQGSRLLIAFCLDLQGTTKNWRPPATHTQVQAV